MINTSIFGEKKDYILMGKALDEAHSAALKNEVPIGAIVVDADGIIIGAGHNLVERECSQRAHAEMIALNEAGKKIGNWRLENCWLYVTLEPCSMCINMVLLSRLAGIVYGAASPLFGYRLDNVDSIRVYKSDAPIIIADVRAQESAELLKTFFKKRREDNEQ